MAARVVCNCSIIVNKCSCSIWNHCWKVKYLLNLSFPYNFTTAWCIYYTSCISDQGCRNGPACAWRFHYWTVWHMVMKFSTRIDRDILDEFYCQRSRSPLFEHTCAYAQWVDMHSFWSLKILNLSRSALTMHIYYIQLNSNKRDPCLPFGPRKAMYGLVCRQSSKNVPKFTNYAKWWSLATIFNVFLVSFYLSLLARLQPVNFLIDVQVRMRDFCWCDVIALCLPWRQWLTVRITCVHGSHGSRKESLFTRVWNTDH